VAFGRLKKGRKTVVPKQLERSESILNASDHGKKGKTGCLRSPSLFVQIAVNKMQYSGAEASPFLGVTTSNVNRLTASKELDEVKTHT